MRPITQYQQRDAGCISIHAPLTGCDIAGRSKVIAVLGISIHAPLTGCDYMGEDLTTSLEGFQSTHP